jgi:putative DNA primase/helicase
LCQGWIAAGRPRGSHGLGSYDAWAQTMGGVLEVAGIEGFLGNLDEMLEAADGESAVWRSFVGSWWDRFGTAEVSTGNLWELALSSEPPLPLGPGNEQSRRTKLGIALGKLRDRVFRVGRLTVQVKRSGTSQGANRWALAIDENIGRDERSQRSPTPPDPAPTPAEPVTVVTVGDRCDSNGHGKTDSTINDLREFCDRCDRCDPFPTPYACADAHAPARENREKRSQGSQGSPDPATARDSARDRCGERSPARSQPSPTPAQPAWLEDVP